MMTRIIELQICLGMVTGTTTYTIHKIWKNVAERLRSNYLPTKKLLSSRLEQYGIAN